MELSNPFRARCSSLGTIMTNPRSGNGLSATTLAYVHKWIKEQPEFYGRCKNFKSKYTDKGIFCEPESIKFAGEVLGWDNPTKNTERKLNEYIEGECDVVYFNPFHNIKFYN